MDKPVIKMCALVVAKEKMPRKDTGKLAPFPSSIGSVSGGILMFFSESNGSKPHTYVAGGDHQ